MGLSVDTGAAHAGWKGKSYGWGQSGRRQAGKARSKCRQMVATAPNLEEQMLQRHLDDLPLLQAAHVYVSDRLNHLHLRLAPHVTGEGSTTGRSGAVLGVPGHTGRSTRGFISARSQAI